MIYFDNIIFSLQKAGGISVVWQNLIKNTCNLNSSIRFIEYNNANANIFRSSLAIPNELIIKKAYHIFSQLIHPKIKCDNKFIFHSSYFRISNNPNAINVTTVHDFIYEQGKPTLKQKLRIWLNYHAIRKSDAIVCISENTRSDLFKYLPDIHPEKVYVIYNGVSDDYRQLKYCPYPQYSKSVLFVGGRDGYKNFNLAVKTMSKQKYELLICGAPLTKREKRLLECYLPNRYHVIEYPSNAELCKIYNSVFCLLYPSSYEGFGLPVLEAQRSGCAVIALNKSSIPEIIGDETLLLSELNDYYLNKAMSVLEDSQRRLRIINDGKINSLRFSWVKMGMEYLDLYKKLLNE